MNSLLSELTRRFSATKARFIFLGDLVDRGMAGSKTMDALVEFFEYRPASALILGNHDEYLLKCFQGTLDVNEGRKWLWNGGDTTLASYGFHDRFTITELKSTLNKSDPSHRLLLERAVPMVLTDRYCFVHAGIDPNVPLDQQDGRTTRWIRDGFLDYPDLFEKVVVHGHSITQTGLPEVRPNRIAIDTGSYQTGRISAAVFEEDDLAGFICAEQIGTEIRLRSFNASVREAELEL
ncbi:metallophosphoesterase [Rhizobium sp. Rhizsp82]|uniref:metallophosphoesterase n=1 Tax=Rhizobium sp. Rhizsp82 TaxID=3243057 RepID=UPI0039B5AE8D